MPTLEVSPEELTRRDGVVSIVTSALERIWSCDLNKDIDKAFDDLGTAVVTELHNYRRIE